MKTDRESRGLRGRVKRVETRAKSLIHWQVDPFRENEWLDEICVYDREGKLLEWYSVDNQVMEQESIRHRYVYDSESRLIEKRGFDEDDSPENVTEFIYDRDGALCEEIHINLKHPGRHHLFYDEKGNVRESNIYDGIAGSLKLVRRWNYTYKATANTLETRVFHEEGSPDNLRRISPDYKYVTTFDGAGNKIKYERYFYDWLEQVEIFDPAGQLIESKLYSDRDKLAWHYAYTYSKAGLLAFYSFEDGSNLREYFYTYDQFENVRSLKDYENGRLVNEEEHTYEYDLHNNWTTHVDFRDNDLARSSTTSYERSFLYFDSHAV